jgi:cellulose biosynthesis protein BcsE
MRGLAIKGLGEKSFSLVGSSSYVVLAGSVEQGVEYGLASLNPNSKNFIISEDIDRFYAKDPSMLFNWHWSDVEKNCYPFRINRTYFLKNNGFAQLLNEIKFYPHANKSHIILHLDEELLKPLKFEVIKEMLEQADEFARATKSTIFWVLTGDLALTFFDRLRHFNQVIAGLITTSTEAASQTLFIDFWRHETGYYTEVSCQVISHNPFTLKVYKKQDSGHFQQFADQNDVLLNHSIVPSDTKLPPSYTVFESNEALYDAAKGKKAATIIFSINKKTDQFALAKQCLELRKSNGNWLKIVLKNTDGVIRHKDECLFLTVGVNLILHSSTDISRLMSQVQAIQGYRFSRPLPPSFDDVVSYSQGSVEKGYLPVFRFIDEVFRHRETSVNTGVSGVMVVLKLQKGLNTEDVVSLFNVKRSGDIFTATEKNIYIYLNACRENDVDLALSRMFRLSLGEFFLFHDVFSTELSIEEQCRTLRKVAMNGDAKDYSGYIDASNVTHFKPAQSDTNAHSQPDSIDFNRNNAKRITLKIRNEHE